MNVASLFFAAAANRGGSNTPQNEAPAGEFAAVFEEVTATVATASAEKQSAGEGEWTPAQETQVEVEDADPEMIAEAVAAMIAQAVQTVVPPVENADAQQEAVTLTMTFTVEDLEALAETVHRLHALFARMGFSTEEIREALKVNQTEEALGSELSALVTPAEGDFQSVFVQESRSLTLTVSLQLPEPQIQVSMETLKLMVARQGEVKAGETETAPVQTAVTQPEIPAPKAEAKAEAPKETVTPALEVQDAEAALLVTVVKKADAPAPVQPEETTQAGSVQTEAADTEAVLVLSEDRKVETQNSESNTRPQVAIALRALAETVARLALEEDAKVVVEVHAANQDQDPGAEAQVVAEEARIVIEKQSAVAEEAVETLAIELHKRPVSGILEAVLKTALGSEEASLLPELQQLTARIALQEAEAAPGALQGKSRLTVGTLNTQGGYGALGRLVKLQPVGSLLKDLSLDTTEPPAALAEAQQAAAPMADKRESFAFEISQAVVANQRTQSEPVTLKDVAMPKETWTLPQEPEGAREALISKLSSKMQHMAAAGAAAQEVRIALKPEHLGDLRIRLEAHEGSVQATFVVESQRVKDILQAGFNTLRQDLQEAGMKLENFQVSVRDNRQSQGFAWGQDSGQGQPRNGNGTGKGVSHQASMQWDGQGQVVQSGQDGITVNVLV